MIIDNKTFLTRVTAALWLVTWAMLPGHASAAAPLTFAGPSVCPEDAIQTPATILPLIGHDISGLSLEFEADEIETPDRNTLRLRGSASLVQGARAIYANRLVFDKASYRVRAGSTVGWTEPSTLDKLDEGLLDLKMKTDIFPANRPAVVIRSIAGDRVEADWLELEMQTQIGQAENVRFEVARRPDVAKRIIVYQAPYDNHGYSFAMPGGRGSVKAPALACCSGDRLSSMDSGSTAAEAPKVGMWARGTAKRFYFEGEDRERLQDVHYSRCAKGDDNVFYTAKELVLDHARGDGIAKHMVVHFHRLPILYFPYVAFPISDERRTGFLFPTFGFGDNWGFNFRVPFYWNIAPQRDATFNGHYMANRGILLGGEYRYIGETDSGNFNGLVRGEWLPDDKVTGGARHGWSFSHQQRLGDHWDGDIDVGYVSDRDYLSDLGDGLEVTSASHIPQEIRIGYRSDSTVLNARLQQYQIVDPSVDEGGEPYARLPGIDIEWDTPLRGRQFKVNVESSLNRFSHPVAARTQGTRLHLAPFGELNFDRTYGYLRPRLTFAFTGYTLENTASEDASRTLPMVHIDSRLYLDRDMSFGGAPHTQGLDLKGYYVYIPYQDQSDLPNFDSGDVGFDNISNYYHRSRFYGDDRIGDTHRVTIGAETRVLEQSSGFQRFNAEIAQMLFLSDRRVRVDKSAPALTHDYSNLLGNVDIAFNDKWGMSMFSDWQWDEHKISKFRLGLDYSSSTRRQFAAGYWYDPTDGHDEVSFETTWPLGQRWQLGVRNIYAIDQSDNQYGAVSLGYDGCCWAIQFNVEDDRSDGDNSGPQIMFTLKLKGLGRISSGEIARVYGATTSLK